MISQAMVIQCINFTNSSIAFLATISEDDMCSKQNHWNEEVREMCQQKILERVVEYCGENLVELELYGIDVRDEMMPTMEHLLKRLHKLSLTGIGIGEAFLKSLTSELPELEELKLSLRPNWNAFAEWQMLRSIVYISHLKNCRRFHW